MVKIQWLYWQFDVCKSRLFICCAQLLFWFSGRVLNILKIALLKRSHCQFPWGCEGVVGAGVISENSLKIFPAAERLDLFLVGYAWSKQVNWSITTSMYSYCCSIFFSLYTQALFSNKKCVMRCATSYQSLFGVSDFFNAYECMLTLFLPSCCFLSVCMS